MALINLSPIAKRRLQQFCANRRGFWSLWLFLILFFFTLGAEFIANDLPEPDSPTSASVSPRLILNDTLRTACSAPCCCRKSTDRSVTSRRVSAFSFAILSHTAW